MQSWHTKNAHLSSFNRVSYFLLVTDPPAHAHLLLLDCLSDSSTCSAHTYSAEKISDRSEAHITNLHLHPPPKKKFKSEAWDYFGYPKNERGIVLEHGYPVCKKKKKSTSVQSKGYVPFTILIPKKKHEHCFHAMC